MIKNLEYYLTYGTEELKKLLKHNGTLQFAYPNHTNYNFILVGGLDKIIMRVYAYNYCLHQLYFERCTWLEELKKSIYIDYKHYLDNILLQPNNLDYYLNSGSEDFLKILKFGESKLFFSDDSYYFDKNNLIITIKRKKNKWYDIDTTYNINFKFYNKDEITFNFKNEINIDEIKKAIYKDYKYSLDYKKLILE